MMYFSEEVEHAFREFLSLGIEEIGRFLGSISDMPYDTDLLEVGRRLRSDLGWSDERVNGYLHALLGAYSYVSFRNMNAEQVVVELSQRYVPRRPDGLLDVPRRLLQFMSSPNPLEYSSRAYAAGHRMEKNVVSMKFYPELSPIQVSGDDGFVAAVMHYTLRMTYVEGGVEREVSLSISPTKMRAIALEMGNLVANEDGIRKLFAAGSVKILESIED